MNTLYTVKIVVGGDGGIGKTTYVKVFCGYPYSDQKVTIGLDLHVKKIKVNGLTKILQIWDLGGERQFRFFLPDYFKGAHGILLGFDISRVKTYLSLEDWMKAIRKKCPQTPIGLVAYKVDKNYHPAIRKEKCLEFVDKFNLIGFSEVSAKENRNLNSPFRYLLEKIFESSEVPLQIEL